MNDFSFFLAPGALIVAQHEPESHAVPAVHAAPAAAEAHHKAAPAHAAPAQVQDAAHADTHAAQVAREAESHHDAAASHEADPFVTLMPEEAPNFFELIAVSGHQPAEHGEGHEGGHHAGLLWFDPLFSLFVSMTFFFFLRKALRRPSIEKPGKGQVAAELFLGGLINFFGDVIGEKHIRKYIPYIGTIWIYILLSNLAGLVPGLKSPTSTPTAAFALGICTFFFVNGSAIQAGGWKHYMWHLMGGPTDVIGWALSPLMLFLEVVGTLIKPVSLSLRLWGNIMGEDRLLATFLGLGMVIGSFVWATPTPMIGLPLHFPFFFLALLGSTIQATVFAMLTTVYIAMLLPHEHHDHDHDGYPEADHDEGIAGALEDPMSHLQPPPVA